MAVTKKEEASPGRELEGMFPEHFGNIAKGCEQWESLWKFHFSVHEAQLLFHEQQKDGNHHM